MTYVIEIPLTFLFFAPTAALKRLTFAAQLALMLLIMATGNYNFFNILFGSDIFEICINMDSRCKECHSLYHPNVLATQDS